MKPLGLYVHIPFCARKCVYCDFASYPGRAGDMPAYADAVCRELSRRAQRCQGRMVDSVFFGGGTPSLLPPALFLQLAQAIRAHFTLTADAEWTVECNPGTLSAPFVNAMKESGVNRVSMGMQAAQERLLRGLGRIHTLRDVQSSVALLRAAGMDNLNLDLMLGLPGQTAADWAETLRAALACQPTHLSCYALILEEGTPLFAQAAAGAVDLPGEEADRAAYQFAREFLRERGYPQYEISNFAKPGFECIHNVHCWQREEYLGFGCAAHSLFEEERSANPADLDAYLRGDAPTRERIAPEEAMFESLMLGLRLTQGMDEGDFLRRHGRALWDVYGAGLSRAVADGRLWRKGGRVALTERGMDVMNSVLLEVM